MAIKTTEIGLNYFKLKDSLHQVFKNPRFSFSGVSSADVSKRRNEQLISDSIVDIVRFVFEAKFTTQDQISRATKLDVKKEVLDQLVKNKFLNYFVLNQYPEEKLHEESGDLRFYVLDFAGIYLLAYEGVDVTRWRFTDYFASSTVIKKALVQAEVLIAFKSLNSLKVRQYKEHPEFRLASNNFYTDFSVSLESPVVGSQPLNLIGYVVEAGMEDLLLSENLREINQVFKETKAGLKYYPLGETTLPRMLLIIEDGTDAGAISRTAKVTGRCSDYAGAELLIVGYNELAQNGLANSTYYTINTTTNQETGARKIDIGKYPKSPFN